MRGAPFRPGCGTLLQLLQFFRKCGEIGHEEVAEFCHSRRQGMQGKPGIPVDATHLDAEPAGRCGLRGSCGVWLSWPLHPVLSFKMFRQSYLGGVMSRKSLTRRSFLRASSAAGLLAATRPLGIAKPVSDGDTEQGAVSANEESKMRPIPSCAWSRPLGNLPKIDLRPEK